MRPVLAEAPSRTQAAAAPKIEVIALTKRFRRAGGGTITPVDGVSLQVAPGELVVLLGPSGCGKTTLLRCVAGLERPDAGEIVIEGQTAFSSRAGVFVPTEQRRLSMIFQTYALWPHMSVFQNVAYPLETHRLPAAEIRRRVLETLELVGVGGLENQFPGRISGGQQQRVALARSLVASRSIVLFDEPLSNVDAQVRAQLRFELKRLQKQIGFSSLYVTHDQSEALELGDRVAVLEAGRIVALGEPRLIYDYPSTEYVARFIGTANIWRGRVVARQPGRTVVDTEFGELVAEDPPGDVPCAAPAGIGDRVAVVVRPEKLRLTGAAPAGGINALAVQVEARVFAGPYTEYLVRRNATTARVWQSDDSGDNRITGAEAWLSVHPSRVFVLPDRPVATGGAAGRA